MTSALLVFASTFLTVFALGLQSLNVNQGHYLAAAGTSFAISSGHLWLYRVMPNPGALDYVGYYLGGIVGIVTSMWFHRVMRTWWKARGREALAAVLAWPRRLRDEAKPCSRCVRQRRGPCWRVDCPLHVDGTDIH